MTVSFMLNSASSAVEILAMTVPQDELCNIRLISTKFVQFMAKKIQLKSD
jgi:hypothetical protein